MEDQSVRENVKRIQEEIAEAAVKHNRNPDEVNLMAVTKKQPPELVNAAIACGVRLLGENRAQEMLEKYDDYNKENVEIHFIGHLQTNKVKSVVGKVSMIQSVDSIKLAEEINRISLQRDCITEVLLEINSGGELSKNGISPENAAELAQEIAVLSAVRLRGLMTIPPICDEIIQIERYFSQMQALLVDIRGKNIDNVSMEILSMGMSGDYIHAIKHGATIIRIGTALFGQRN